MSILEILGLAAPAIGALGAIIGFRLGKAPPKAPPELRR